MGTRFMYSLFIFSQFGLFFLFSGSSDAKRSAVGNAKQLDDHVTEVQAAEIASISNTQKDITTPITTVPTITTPNPTPTSSTTPIMNPNSDPEYTTSPATMTPMVTPAATTTTTTPVLPGASWCVASQSASPTALQVALDYACGYGGADCSAIQPSGSCYNPNTLRDHASYAFNNYYQKNPIPSGCNFGGTAVTTSTDPSNGICQFPCTSTSSSVLNTTNSNGATVYGAVPSSPYTPSASAKIDSSPSFMLMACLTMLLAKHLL